MKISDLIRDPFPALSNESGQSQPAREGRQAMEQFLKESATEPTPASKPRKKSSRASKKAATR